MEIVGARGELRRRCSVAGREPGFYHRLNDPSAGDFLSLSFPSTTARKGHLEVSFPSTTTRKGHLEVQAEAGDERAVSLPAGCFAVERLLAKRARNVCTVYA